jgi:uncharacterized membrane protein YdcZ (DUF606 family)
VTATTNHTKVRDLSIWGFAFGYFACYVPYSSMTKATTKGLLGKLHGVGVPGPELLPISVAASLVGMLAFLTAMGWWRHAGRRTFGGVSVPFPSKWTFMSGLCTAAIIATTTLAYTISGVSIVFMMLLMRGGVLAIAPIIDALTGRKVRWFSALALLLSLAALVVAFTEDSGFKLRLAAGIDVAIYLTSYFIRLRFMSRLAKSDEAHARTRYFVEEQIVATPVLMLFLGACALANYNDFTHQIHAGFTTFFDRPLLLEGILIGLFSQGTGIFGGLILLDKRENTYSVPVNRSSSILAGVLASTSLHFVYGTKAPSSHQLIGAALIIAAIVALTLPVLLKRKPAVAAPPQERRA